MFKAQYIKQIILVNIFFLLFAIVYSFNCFRNIKPNEFLVVHDQSPFFSSNHIARSSYLISSFNGGLGNAIPLFVGLPNRIFYAILFNVGLSLRTIEMILFPLCIYILLSFSFFGFYKLYLEEIEKINIYDWLNILIITFFYSFSMNLILATTFGYFWSIGYVFTLSLFPFLIYYINKFLKDHGLSSREAIITSLIMYISAITIFVFAPILIVLPVYCLIQILLMDKLRLDLKKAGLIICIFLLLFSFSVTAYLLELSLGSNEIIGARLIQATARLQDKGILSMFFFYFSWIIYVPWEPRSIITFYQYYLSQFYITSVLSIYIFIAAFVAKNKSLTKKILPYLSLLFLGIFLGKGGQKPFGIIYNALINLNSAFTVIRSPDNKFGIIIIFSLAAIIMHIFLHSRKSIALKIYLLAITLIISYPFWTGEAVLGKNVTGKSGDWITSITPDQQQVVDKLNSDPSLNNVITYPLTSMGPYAEKNGGMFIGYDIMPMLSNQSLLFADPVNKEPEFNRLVNKIMDKYDFSENSHLNIKYFLINKNLYYKNNALINKFRKNLTQQLKVEKLVDNNSFELYLNKDKSFTPRISLKNNSAKITYQYISPVKYLVSIDGLDRPDQLIFLESYRNSWFLFPADAPSDAKNNFITDFKYLFIKPLSVNSHKQIYDYANSWMITPANRHLDLVLYYKDQSILNIAFLITLTTLAGCIIFVAISINRKKSA